jgi:ATP-binding cassette subfamily C (CFTR/MRP) protein 4
LCVKARSPVYSHVSVTLNGLATVRAFGSENIFEQQFYRYQNDHNVS